MNKVKRYALGCAFTAKNLLENFPLKKLKTNCKLSKSIINDNHRNILAERIFKESVRLVIQDVVINNATFWLPLTGNKKCSIRIKIFEGKAFKDLRQGGKWKNIDIINSNFSGYQIVLLIEGQRTPRIKFVYVNKEFRNILDKQTNEGFNYGDSNNDKYIKDYYQDIYALFPTIPQSDIQRILIFGWKSLYLHNSYGGDVIISGRNIWCYFGRLKKQPLDHFFYYIRKLTVKLRVLYRRRKVEWNGYYYFALSEKQYQNYLSQQKCRGRKRKYFNFGAVYIYQIYDECKITECYKKYIFRIPYITKTKIKYFIRELITCNAELVTIRDPLKFKDILVYDNEYETL